MSPSVNQSITISQTSINSVMQAATNTCINQCENMSTDETIIITDSSNVTVNAAQTCSVVGSTCILKSSFKNVIDAVQSAAATQLEAAESDLLSINFGDYNESINMNQYIKNQVSQLFNNTCKNQSTTITKNALLYINKTNGANVNFATGGAVTNTQCQVSNTSTTQITTSQTAKASQKTIIAGPLMIIAAIVGIVVVGLIICLVLLGATKIGKAAMEAKKARYEAQGAIMPMSGDPADMPPITQGMAMGQPPQELRSDGVSVPYNSIGTETGARAPIEGFMVDNNNRPRRAGPNW